MNYKKILEKIYRNSESNNLGLKFIGENSFHKLAEELDALFAKRIVSRSLPTNTEPISLIVEQAIKRANIAVQALAEVENILKDKRADTVNKEKVNIKR